MATIYGESLSPLMREIEIMTLESESAYNKIEAMEAMYESLNTSRYMEAEARVLYENGTDEDLYHYYMEAEAEKTNQSGGIVMSIINWFKTQLGKFGNWLAQVCGANNSRLDQLAGQQIEHNKADDTFFDTLKSKWNGIVKAINKACQQLEQNAPVASIAVPTLGSFGLGFLAGGFNKFLSDNPEKVTSDGSKAKEHAATSEQVTNDCNKLIKRLEALAVKFQNMINSGVQKVNTKWTNAGEEVTNKMVAKQNEKNAANAAKNAAPDNTAGNGTGNGATNDGTGNQAPNNTGDANTGNKTESTLDGLDVDGDLMLESRKNRAAKAANKLYANNIDKVKEKQEREETQKLVSSATGDTKLNDERQTKVDNQANKIHDVKNNLEQKGVAEKDVKKAVTNQTVKAVNTAKKQAQKQRLDDAGVSNARQILGKIQQLLTFLRMILSSTISGAKDVFSTFCSWVKNFGNNGNGNANGNAAPDNTGDNTGNGATNDGTGNPAPDNTGNGTGNGDGGQPQTDQNVGNASARDGLDIPGEVINEAKTVNMFGLSEEDMMESTSHSEDEINSTYEMMENILEKF